SALELCRRASIIFRRATVSSQASGFVSAAIYHDLVTCILRKAAQIAMGHQRTIRLPSQQQPLLARYHQQTPVGQPVDTKRYGGRHARHHLAIARRIQGNHLLLAPVAEPESSLVPARRFAESKTR